MYTYISLFSCAGVGCYGFKQNGFECIATNELIKARLDVQRANNKCKYESGYINGDIHARDTKDKIAAEIDRWHKDEGITDVDVLVATPPCQGMSSANLKKNDEQQRNSLVVEAIAMVLEIKPRFFVFENVRAFMTTTCTDMDGCDRPIGEAITKDLGDDYTIAHKVINFKDYGVPSSRPRTLVIGVRKDVQIDPEVLFPQKQDEITLRTAIGDLKSLTYGEQDPSDLYHFARVYPEYMRDWFTGLKEGCSMLDNPEEHRPYKLVKGQREPLQSTDIHSKFSRLHWDKPCKCVHTRNDILGSQSTIHPSDDRVLSIRELMRVMTIPDTFVWTEDEKTVTDTTAFLKKHELNIRRCIGEAVPTHIMGSIATNIIQTLQTQPVT